MSKHKKSITQLCRKNPFTLLAILIMLVYFIFLMLFFEPAISTPDAQGYFTQAKLIAKEGKTYLEPDSFLEYIGPHWSSVNTDKYYTTFPPGFPAILSVVYKTLGIDATLLVNPIMAALSLFGLFLLCRLWVGSGWGILAMLLMAFIPFVNEHALFGDSHTSVIFFLIWGLYFLARWLKTNSMWWIFFAGVFFGIIPTLRYPGFLFVIVFGIFLLLNFNKSKNFWRSFIAGVTGASIPVIALGIRNQIAFGAFWKTGYDIYHEPAHFGLNYFVSYFPIYLQQLLFEGLGLIFILGLIGVFMMCFNPETRKTGILFILLIVPITVLYMSYYWRPDPQSMRFLMPTFPVYILATVWFLKLITSKNKKVGITVSVLLLLITILWGLPKSVFSMQQLKNKNAVLTRITDELNEKIPHGSILITNEGISQHLDFIGSWRLIDMSIIELQELKPPRFKRNDENIPKNILKRKPIRNIEARSKYADLVGVELFDTFSKDVHQWAGNNKKIYLIAKQDQIDWFKTQLLQEDDLAIIDTIKLPYINPEDYQRPNGIGLKKPNEHTRKHQMKPGPMGVNTIFDLILDGESLYIVEWKQKK